jgi:hypothetical protein
MVTTEGYFEITISHILRNLQHILAGRAITLFVFNGDRALPHQAPPCRQGGERGGVYAVGTDTS